MKPVYRGVAVAAVHCLLVLSVAGKYALDRERLPRAWVRTMNYDPNLPIRGRYVSLSLEAQGAVEPAEMWRMYPARLSVRDGHLMAEQTLMNTGVTVASLGGGRWRLVEPVPFFIPEHVADPSRRKPGEELWVEVSVPQHGPPRPVRLAVKKDGEFKVLDLR